MIQEKVLARMVRAIISGGLLASATAFVPLAIAQEVPGKMATVQVTGTRITSPGVTSASPISSISADELKLSQPISVEEFFKSLPAATPAIGQNTNNGTAGGATIDLRGLGSNRTLVLVNGRRIVPFNLAGVVDTNSVPLALISRVDSLTGGASVAYGADAVAGVVNFNLKRNFTGVDLSTSHGVSAEGDAKRRRTDLTIGANLPDNQGNVVLSIGSTKADPLTQGARPFGVNIINSITGLPTGSVVTVPAAFLVAKGAGGTDALAGLWQINPVTGALGPVASLYNTNPTNFYVTGLERTQATSMGNFKINDHAEVYADLFYTASTVASALAPSGTFGNSFNVPIGNPYIPAAARQQICDRAGITAANCVAGNATLVPMTVNRRLVELGPRYNNFNNKTLQYTLGVKGEAWFDWTYDAYWTRGNADQVQTRQNYGSFAKVSQALNALNSSSCVNPANGCVPLNVFGAAGSITPAQLAFINENALLMQGIEQDVGAVSFSGDLGRKLVSPLANQPVSLAISLEQRKMTATTTSDAASQIPGEVLGAAVLLPDSVGSFRLREAAVEAVLPLVRDKPYMRALNLELGYRETEFTAAGKSQQYGSWKYGGDWQPVQSLRLRASVQKATRAPNVNELFSPVVTGLGFLTVDPCQGNRINRAEANTPGTLSNLCRATGVPQSEIGSLPAPSSGQINVQTGGNPSLQPEQAKTKTVGFVWEPVPRLALTVDYYKIDIDHAVSSQTTTDVLDGCYNAAANPGLANNALCGLIGRNPVNGTFDGAASRGVLTALSNLGTQGTSGVDFNVAYKFTAASLGLAPKFGRFDVSLGLNQVNSFRFQPTPTSLERDCLGYYSVACGPPVYKRRFSQRSNWVVGDFSLGYNWRYVSAVVEEPGGTSFLPAFSSIPAYSYVDVSAAWNVTKMIRLNLSVNNVANKQPPMIGSTIATNNGGNTFPQNYDPVGRYFAFGAAMKF
jgi:iron complex outermembrane receptor protein